MGSAHDNAGSEEGVLELVDYLRVVRRRFWLVFLAVVVCAGVAVGLSFSKTKEYRATVQISVSGTAGTVPTVDSLTLRQIAIQVASSLAQFAPTSPVVDTAMQTAGYPVGTRRPGVEASSSDQILTITVTDSDAVKVARVANAYVQSLPPSYLRLTSSPASGRPVISALNGAGVPKDPFSPNPVRDGGIGLALGLILGLGAVFVREALDRSFGDADVLEAHTGLPVLGVVPRELTGVELPTVSHPTSGRAEAYRTVRTNVQFAGSEHTLKSIVITSATAGEGKTTLATNLAVAFARTGHSVVLVDADMRKPRVIKALAMPPVVHGLSDVLTGEVSLERALLPYEPGLSVLPAGPFPGNPSELLGSSAMAELLTSLGEQFDVVLIDSPPILPVTDPLVLGVHASGLVVVVRLGVTSRERLKRAMASLKKLDIPVLGIAANGAVASGDAAYSYGYKYAYGKTAKPSKPAKRPRRDET